MDSMDVMELLNFAWTLMVIHMVVGLVFSKVPFLASLYLNSAVAYAKAAKEAYEGSETDPASQADDTVEIQKALAVNAIEMANIAIDYCQDRKRHFVNMLWVTELKWTMDNLKRTEAVERQLSEMKKRAAAQNAGN